MENEHKTAAMYLGYLRKGTTQYDSFISYLRREVQNGGFSLADIGTSEEEIAELRIKGCKTYALHFLALLRNGTTQYDSFISYLRREVQNGGFSLAAIGTSEGELAGVPVKAA